MKLITGNLITPLASSFPRKNAPPAQAISTNTQTAHRTANVESMMLSFMAENNLSFTLAPKLVELLKEFAADPKALSSVSLTLCSAAYKLTYGVSDFFKTGNIESMCTQPFSLNIDEATIANNNKKVLSILVSYFNPPKKKIVIKHFASIEITKCDSLTIFQAVCDIIDSNSIPWISLQSCLMDSCSVMRGHKTGFETTLRAHAPHLLDISGDSSIMFKILFNTFASHLNSGLRDYFAMYTLTSSGQRNPENSWLSYVPS